MRDGAESPHLWMAGFDSDLTARNEASVGMAQSFRFFDVGLLRDGELSLQLDECVPAHPLKGIEPAYRFKLYRDGEEREIGRIDLRIGHTHDIVMYNGHIGYAVEPHARGHHFAERASRLLLPLARKHGLRELWITCNPDNIPSRRTCERLGARLIDTVPVPSQSEMYQRGEREKCRYLLSIEP